MTDDKTQAIGTYKHSGYHTHPSRNGIYAVHILYYVCIYIIDTYELPMKTVANVSHGSYISWHYTLHICMEILNRCFCEKLSHLLLPCNWKSVKIQLTPRYTYCTVLYCTVYKCLLPHTVFALWVLQTHWTDKQCQWHTAAKLKAEHWKYWMHHNLFTRQLLKISNFKPRFCGICTSASLTQNMNLIASGNLKLNKAFHDQ